MQDTLSIIGDGRMTIVQAVGDYFMFENILDAIRQGDWYFEPKDVDTARFEATSARPGTDEKVAVLAERVQAGLPLWHNADGPDIDEG